MKVNEYMYEILKTDIVQMEDILARIDKMSIAELNTIKTAVVWRRHELEEKSEDIDSSELETKLFERIRKYIVGEMKMGKSSVINLENINDIFRDIIFNEYYELPRTVRWKHKNIGIPCYGEYPECSNENCWWVRHPDRLREYRGDYYQLVLDEDYGLCENCHARDIGDDAEHDALNAVDYDLAYKFNEWNRERSRKLRDENSADILIIDGKWIEYYMHTSVPAVFDTDESRKLTYSPEIDDFGRKFCNIDTGEIVSEIPKRAE